jgi:hypothetical protein
VKVYNLNTRLGLKDPLQRWCPRCSPVSSGLRCAVVVGGGFVSCNQRMRVTDSQTGQAKEQFYLSTEERARRTSHTGGISERLSPQGSLTNGFMRISFPG